MLATLILLALVENVFSHAVVTAPSPRTSGSAQAAACGAAVTKKLNSGNPGFDSFLLKAKFSSLFQIEVAAKAIDGNWTEACDLYFCRAYTLEDNSGRVQAYAPGQVVSFHIDIEAHHTGRANVSIVDLEEKTIIGGPLFDWPVYANSSLGPSEWPKNESDFDITIPSNLGTQCSTVGACAIQWWWQTQDGSQTYESCIDFTV
ncbi:hypothetical protein DL96DRAFT_1466146 [Flagelloscypha sp. PMI_526]|nr:hypothetical protein DL96DRAFT_1466146 [Flagelloscypha sp. PMI_526]